jgi:aerobic carbon-monoxide dehydrogenase small subunit
MQVSIKVNGTVVSDDVTPRELLVDYLRGELELTGTKVGCETGHCGTCVVRLDGQAVKSCLVLAVQADGGSVDTVEGLSPDGNLNQLQQAMYEEHGTQCGFCAGGVLMSLTDLLEREPHADEQRIRGWLAGNLCRCTGYHSIVRAALRAQQPAPAPEASDNG